MFKLLENLPSEGADLKLDSPLGTRLFKIAQPDVDNEVTIHSEEAFVRVNKVDIMTLLGVVRSLEAFGYKKTGSSLLRMKHSKLKCLIIINIATPSRIDLTVKISRKDIDGEILCDVIKLQKRKSEYRLMGKKLLPGVMLTLTRLDRYLHQLSS